MKIKKTDKNYIIKISIKLVARIRLALFVGILVVAFIYVGGILYNAVKASLIDEGIITPPGETICEHWEPRVDWYNPLEVEAFTNHCN